MRSDHYLPPAKWTREFRQALRLSDAHLKVYAYLESAPESHATGIYFVTLGAVAEMLREERETVAKIVDDLERVNLLFWDAEASVVWVPCVCGEQFRWTNRAGRDRSRDFRLTEARRHLDNLPPSPLADLFRHRWPIFGEEAPTQGAYQGAYQGATQGAYQGATQGATQAPLPVPPPSYKDLVQRIGGLANHAGSMELSAQDEHGLDLAGGAV